MDLTSALFLSLSIILGSARNIFSKNISPIPFGERGFFRMQAAIFIAGLATLLLVNPNAFVGLLPLTVLYGAVYAAFSLSSQWFYTIALRRGATSVCATVYSMGFIIPTLVGMIFWGEKVNAPKIIGIIVVIPALIISGMRDSGKNSIKKSSSNIAFILPMILAMLSAGTVGIIQKLQQRSATISGQTSAMIIITFIICSVTSVICSIIAKPTEIKGIRIKTLCAAGAGVCFASCNLLNTLLAGMLDGTVLYPILNIGIIMLTMLLGMLFFKEKFGWRQAAVIALGASSILLITLS